MTSIEITRNFTENLEKVREERGWTQAQMAEKLQMSLSSYKYMISGKSAKIPIYVAYLVYQTTGKFFFELCGDIVPEMSLLMDYRQLSKERQQAIRTSIAMERAIAAQSPEATLQTKDAPEELLPLYTILGNMEDGMYYDTSNVEYFNVAPYRTFYGDEVTCGVRVTTNHLHPAYHAGDILLVCQRPPRDGDTGLFLNKKNRRLYIRRFRQTEPCRLEPVTEYGETITVDSYDYNDMYQWVKFGYVVATIR